jgi:transposase
MASSGTPHKPKSLEQVVLWIVIALLLALGCAWEAYPRIYLRYHPQRPWPGEPESFGFPPIVQYFFYACLIGSAGFAQLRFSRWFQRSISKTLLRVFLLANLIMLAGMWTFALSNRFWTIQFQAGRLHEVERTMHMGGTFAVLGLWSSLALTLLNLVYGLARKRPV